ncbi:MAG TPA: ABC transporter ATP-binding protein [Solirubrobacteraceae bacterium]|jgi:ABC-type dipeptide/oligopeptide/nickel transport system ATPase subunit|nr:ABC transporter ATP-binding protein [Solirubrobacteraceae bacterium]
MTLLEALGVEVTYPGQAVPALHPLDLVVEEGAAIGIVGESGSGKTTLGRALIGALSPSGGEVRVQGRSWSEIRRTDPQRRSVQMIFQDPYSSLNPHMTARQTVAEAIRHWYGVTRGESRRRAEQLLADVGLPGAAIDRRPDRLSGGQCQRVGIARALACEPRVLVADEPTSSLDVSVQAQILNLLRSLRRTRALALVVISHDLGVIRYLTDRAVVMRSGAVVEQGETERIFAAPRHPYTRALVDAIPGRTGFARALEPAPRAMDPNP